MAQKQDVWRLVDKMAIQCTECQYNEVTTLYADNAVASMVCRCTAKDGLCDFTHTKPDNDKWYPDYKKAIADIPDEQGGKA